MPAGISAPSPMPNFSSPMPGQVPINPALINSTVPLPNLGSVPGVLPPSALAPGADSSSPQQQASSGTPPPTQVAENVAGTDGAAAAPVAAASS